MPKSDCWNTWIFFFRVGLQLMYVIVASFTLIELKRPTPSFHVAHKKGKLQSNKAQLWQFGGWHRQWLMCRRIWKTTGWFCIMGILTWTINASKGTWLRLLCALTRPSVCAQLKCCGFPGIAIKMEELLKLYYSRFWPAGMYTYNLTPGIT